LSSSAVSTQFDHLIMLSAIVSHRASTPANANAALAATDSVIHVIHVVM